MNLSDKKIYYADEMIWLYLRWKIYILCFSLYMINMVFVGTWAISREMKLYTVNTYCVFFIIGIFFYGTMMDFRDKVIKQNIKVVERNF